MKIFRHKTSSSLKEIGAVNAKIDDICLVKPGQSINKSEQNGIFPTLNVLVVGLQHSGKSTLINTILRVLYKEWDKSLQYYATTGGQNGDHCTQIFEKFVPKNLDTICFFDCKAPGKLDDKEALFFETCITTGLLPLSTVSDMKQDPSNRIHASLLVIAPEHLEVDLKKTRIQQLSSILAQYNRRPIVVITHKDELNSKTEQRYRELVNQLCGTEQIVFITNYLSSKGITPPRSLEIDQSIVRLLDMCFVTGDRIFVSDRYSSDLAKNVEKDAEQ